MFTNCNKLTKIFFQDCIILIDKKGRALLRQSGTEPKVRVMIEAETEEKCKTYAKNIVDVIVERGYSVE